MNGKQRREEILKNLKNSKSPLSGKKLSVLFSVSRQAIVQDIALIRATGVDIISTNRGYVINKPQIFSKIFKVSHTDAQIEDELCTIVDLGGVVADVFIWHKAYGKICCPLQINSRRKITALVEDIKKGRSQPLKNITSNYHYHTVESSDEETLILIEKALKDKHYLVFEN